MYKSNVDGKINQKCKIIVDNSEHVEDPPALSHRQRVATTAENPLATID